MDKIKHITAVVLAGGQSRRMGEDKAALPLAGRPLIEHVTEAAARAFETVMVAGPESVATGLKTVPDTCQRIGPLAGVLAGFQADAAEWVFALPCDSPFIPEAFMRGMAELTDGHDVIVPRNGEFLEPLHAIYSRRCVPPIEDLIASGERKIIKLYDLVSILEVRADLLSKWDPQALAFFNLNTPEDLEKAEDILGSDLDFRT